MIYNGTELTTQQGSTSITTKKVREIFNYPYSDKSDYIDKGRNPTRITATILIYTETELNNILTLLETAGPSDLIVGAKLMKKVILQPEFELIAQHKTHKDRWDLPVQFIALDPKLYDQASGDVIYG